MSRTEATARVSTVHISDVRLLLWTRKDHRGCESQTICTCGKDSRNAATAGKVWMMSPSDPSRTTRKRGSGMRRLAHRFQESARGVILRVAHNGYANAEPGRRRALRHALGSVVGSLGVNVRAQFVK